MKLSLGRIYVITPSSVFLIYKQKDELNTQVGGNLTSHHI